MWRGQVNNHGEGFYKLLDNMKIIEGRIDQNISAIFMNLRRLPSALDEVS